MWLGLLTAMTLGLGAGAMLAEAAVLVPWWRSLPPQDFLAWYATNAARLLDFFAPLEVGGAVLAVAHAGIVLRARAVMRGWAVAAAVLALAVLVPFPLYFQEVNARFADGSIAHDRVAAELARWALWHAVRTGLGVLAFGAAVLGASKRS